MIFQNPRVIEHRKTGEIQLHIGYSRLASDHASAGFTQAILVVNEEVVVMPIYEMEAAYKSRMTAKIPTF